MKKGKTVLRPLGAGIGDCYTKAELLEVCGQEIFSKSKRMDTKLLMEMLYALDDRPDEVVAPHREAVWAGIQRRIQPAVRERMPRRKFALVVAMILLLLALAGTGIAWALRAGVISFPSITLPWLPQVTSQEAESLVQQDLATVVYPHCELRVREAAFDGHQLRIVYSVRDTRPNAALTEEDPYESCIAAGKLDDLGSCDSLLINGQRVDLDDTFQQPGDAAGEMLYYLAANVPEAIELDNVLQVEMPIGEAQGFRMPRKVENVRFVLDTTNANQYALTAEPASAIWGDTLVTVERAEFSPLHGLLRVVFSPVESQGKFGPYSLALYDEHGEPIGYEWYSSSGQPTPEEYLVITQYIPTGDWPEHLLLASYLADGSPDMAYCVRLTLTPVD